MTAPRVDEDGLCVCCQLDPASCGRNAELRQRREEQVRREVLLRLPGSTAAQYPGVCGDCGESFDKGEPITARVRPGHRQPIDRSGTSAWRGLLCCEEQS